MFADQQRVSAQWCGAAIGQVIAESAGADDGQLAGPAVDQFVRMPIQTHPVLQQELLDRFLSQPWIVNGHGPINEKIAISIDRDDSFQSVRAAQSDAAMPKINLSMRQIESQRLGGQD